MAQILNIKFSKLQVIQPINQLLDTTKFNIVVYTLDWHPTNHISFIENVGVRKLHKTSPITSTDARTFDTVIFDGSPPMPQKLWPTHCIQNTWGSQVHDDLSIVSESIQVYKGTNAEVDSYSAFGDNQNSSWTKLNAELETRGITDVYVCGLAYDICVAETAKDAIDLGYRTILINDCCRGTDLDKIEEAKEHIIANNGLIVDAKKVN